MKRWPIWLFVAYAVLLFIGTHWPNLKIPTAVVQRPDLVIHLTAFGTWTVLLWWSGLAGLRARWRTAVRVLVIGLVYAAVDEVSQGIPGLGRTVALDDYLADALGVGVGALVAALGAWWLRK